MARRRAQAAYPQHWEADIALRDGSAAHLRPIRPDDADALQAFHRAQSEQSRYLRFFSTMPELSSRDLERFTVVDHVDRVALVVLHLDRIIAVGRFDRVGPAEAEVAFNVSDVFQGRGLASVLLEHLTAAARERGIARFVAEVLPQNHRMLSVFTEAGFDVARQFDDGVVQVSFAIDPTARSAEVRAEREHRDEARSMHRLLQPRSIAIVGVSARRDSAGGRILDALERSGFDGTVHIVSRDAFEIRGRAAHARLADVPAPVDLVVLAVAPDDCLALVPDAAAIGAHALLVVSEGFAESGAEGARLQRRLVREARLAGLRVLGPAAFGFLRPGGEAPINASFAPRLPHTGGVALGGQSTALSAMLLAGAAERGIGVHEFVAVGNRADVSVNDCLQHWEDDPEVTAIGLALESIGNPRKFTRIARRLARKVPLVVLRPPGISSDAPPGHDVRRSRLPRRALDQVLSATGAVRAGTLDELVDVLAMIDREGVPRGARVGICAHTPALAASLRGAAEARGLDVVAVTERIPATDDERMVVRALTSMAAPGEVDLVLFGILDPLGIDLVAAVRQLSAVARGSAVALALCVVTDPERMQALEAVVREDGSLPPVHPTPALAVRAAAGALAARTAPRTDDAPVAASEEDPAAARALIDEALGASTSELRLDPGTSRRLARCYGIEVLPVALVADEDAAVAAADAAGYPVVLKSTDPALVHRPDLGAVRLALGDAAQVRSAFRAIRGELAFSDAPLAVQTMSAPGVPVIIRTDEDPVLGPVISFALSGTGAELLDDVAYAIPPLGRREAARLLRTPASARRFAGEARLPAADLDALADLLVRVARLAEDLPRVRRLELNPVIVSPYGAVPVSVDIVLAPAPNRVDGIRRTLPSAAEEQE